MTTIGGGWRDRRCWLGVYSFALVVGAVVVACSSRGPDAEHAVGRIQVTFEVGVADQLDLLSTLRRHRQSPILHSAAIVCVRYFFLVSVSKAAFGLPLLGSFLAAPGSTFLSLVVPGASPLDLPLS